MKNILKIILLSISPVSVAGEIEDIFGNGIFDVNWGQDISQVKVVYGEAKVRSYGPFVQLELKDGRTVLGIERRPKDKILFAFDSEERLASVGVYYKAENFDDLLVKLDTLFGSHLSKNNPYGVTAEWPVDNGIGITLSYISYGLISDTVFTVSNQALPKPSVDKQDLGF